ncbi:nitrous oxide reductase accessory protein NosL [Halorubrum halodurans]|uniref:Nitrous oxide reductase accessory protein NosL n=1 Tax=Halorubrum halodurans TaxID=1383851 RepID=A0A256IKV7_9EURY|nr:nitrous oxide reductase accessory protein NosL [Halorubrum halodurans]OYR56787.1 nitrous oxide reductase accessory protein NosL [Halorubrum halodurans]
MNERTGSAASAPRSRRRVVGAVAGAVPLALAGCLGGSGDSASISPISLDGERACDQCGMIVRDHPGPVGQVHFADDEPEGGRPAQFCSSVCTYTYRFDAEDDGRDPLATFLTDYSTVDQEVFEEGDDVMFSSHVEASAFARTTELTVVAGSDVVGSMGPELIPFGEESDVESFVAEYGGQPMDAEAVDRGTLEGL